MSSVATETPKWNRADVATRAAVEFYLRCRISSPLKSWFKTKEIAAALDLSKMQVSHAMHVIEKSQDDLAVETRPGSAGGKAWHITRRAD